MDSDYNYLTTIALADSGTPSLALEASANVPFSRGNNTTFDTSQLALNVQASLDSQGIPSRDLMGSALIREIQDWLSKNKEAIGIDAIGQPLLTEEGITIPLHAALRSARSQFLIISSPSFPSSTLSFLDLSLNFSSPNDPTSSHSQSEPREGLLLNQLLAPYPQLLHFTLSPLIDQALEKLVKNLAKWFPICFNPLWVDRISNDLGSFNSISKSLTNILEASTLINTGQLSLDEISKASRLQRELVPHFTSTSAISSSEPAITEREAIEKGLLVLAKQRHLVDPLHLSSTSSTTQALGSQCGSHSKSNGVNSGRGRGRGSNSSDTSSGKGKRVRNEQDQELLIDEDNEDENNEEDLDSSSQSTKRVKRNCEKGWKKELENDAILGGLEDDEFGWTNEGDGLGFVKETDECRRSEDEEMLFDETEDDEEEEVLEM